MFPEASTLLSADPVGEILVMHTVLTAMGIGVTIILLRALLSLRRSGEALPGLLIMIWVMLGIEILRAAWLGCLWLSQPGPIGIDVSIFVAGFIVLVGVPILVSARYLPRGDASTAIPRPWLWLQRAMVVTAVVGFGILLGAIGFRLRTTALLGTAAAFILTALFLFSRITFYRHLQVRRRPLLLFAGFMITGLLVLAAIAIYSVVTSVRIRLSLPLASLNTAGMMLALCGIIFLFANLRLADLIVKRALRIVLWTLTSLGAWLVLMHSGSLPRMAGRIDQDLLCLLVVCSVTALAPTTERHLNRWVDEWVFEQPDLKAAIASLWRTLLKLETREEVFETTGMLLQDLLGLAAVRLPKLESSEMINDLASGRPGPYFVPTSSGMAQGVTPPADIMFPLFVDGRPSYAIALSVGVVRPPLTLWEMDFVERVAARMQIWLDMRSAAERAQREASFREELANAELKALRAQVNPHFLFNSLNTIADLAVIAPSQAEEMTLRLSVVFRYVLVNTDRHFTSLREELEFARTYLHIEQTRFGDRLKVEFDIEPTTLEQQIPTLLLQPLIENALKHGLAPRRGGGMLTICCKSFEDRTSISISDDGVGLREPGGASEHSTHIGAKNVSHRLEIAYGGRASFTLRNRQQGGTEALILIPRGQSV